MGCGPWDVGYLVLMWHMLLRICGICGICRKCRTWYCRVQDDDRGLNWLKWLKWLKWKDLHTPMSKHPLCLLVDFKCETKGTNQSADSQPKLDLNMKTLVAIAFCSLLLILNHLS